MFRNHSHKISQTGIQQYDGKPIEWFIPNQPAPPPMANQESVVKLPRPKAPKKSKFQRE